MNALRVPLRVVFYEEDDEWVAHCLEFDLVGCASTREAALQLLSEAIVTQLLATRQNQNFENLFTPASGEYLAKFAAGHDVAEYELRIPWQSPDVVIEHAEVREFRENWDSSQSVPGDLISA